MPVPVRCFRSVKTLTFARRFPALALQQPRGFEHPIDAAGTDRHYIAIHHHVRQASIAFQRILCVILHDRFLLPGLEPMIAANQPVVFIDFAIALLPVVKLTGCDTEPFDEPANANLAAGTPAVDKIDQRIAGIVGNPKCI